MTQTQTQTQGKVDHELKTRICDELRWSPSVNADRVGVAVADGAVTLSGEVDTYPQKEGALAAAFRVQGVTGVADEIVIKHAYGRREDIDIARDAAHALDSLIVIPKGSVKVTVHDGHVVLSGTATWNYQREAAERAVQNAPGVTAVQNSIHIRPTLPFAAERAAAEIRAALVRNAETDADRIHVDTHGTTIELTGTVRSWSEARQAGHAAWATPGVTQVHNLIRVIP